MRNLSYNEQCTGKAGACTSASFSRALLVIITNVILLAFVFLCLLGLVEVIIILGILVLGVVIWKSKSDLVNTDFKEFMQTA